MELDENNSVMIPQHSPDDSWLEVSDDSILEVEGIQLTKNGIDGVNKNIPEEKKGSAR